MGQLSHIKSKYRGNLLQRPENVDEATWRVFVAVVRDGQSLRQFSRNSGLSVFKVTAMILRVDQMLDPSSVSSHAGTQITLDSPLEDLDLSTRARNALRQAGCDTVRSVLNTDFTRSVRSVGSGTRQEVARVLSNHGFTPPSALHGKTSGLENLVRDLSRLRRTIEERYRSSLYQLTRLEDSLRKLSNSSANTRGYDK